MHIDGADCCVAFGPLSASLIKVSLAMESVSVFQTAVYKRKGRGHQKELLRVFLQIEPPS